LSITQKKESMSGGPRTTKYTIIHYATCLSHSTFQILPLVISELLRKTKRSVQEQCGKCRVWSGIFRHRGQRVLQKYFCKDSFSQVLSVARIGNGSRGSGIHKFYRIAGHSGEIIIRNSGVIEVEGQTFDTGGGPHDMIRYFINTLKTVSFSMASKPLIRILTYKTFLSPLAILAVTTIVGAIFSSTITFSTYAQEEDSQGEVDSEEQQQPSLPILKDGSG
jgi:hypothetical protein